MHDGAVIVEGTPDEIRANELVHQLYLGSRYE
jgi:branched-chain amino acid transport system ATP-binding protein